MNYIIFFEFNDYSKKDFEEKKNKVEIILVYFNRKNN